MAAKTEELWLWNANHAMALFKNFGCTQIQERHRGGTESAHHSNYEEFSAKHRETEELLSQNEMHFNIIRSIWI